MRTFYEILGVPRDATSEEILKAYRKRCIETHPDKGGKELDFLNVRKGYEILSNPDSRKKYDEWVRIKEEEERKRLNNELLVIKKRVIPLTEEIINKYCSDSLFKTMLLTYLYGENSIYKNLSNFKNEKAVAALVLKRILAIVIEDKTYDIKSAMDLDSICNDIIVGKKDVPFSKEEVLKTNQESVKKKKEEHKSHASTLIGFFIVFLGVLFVWVLCQQEAKKIEDVKKEYTNKTQIPIKGNVTKEAVQKKDVVPKDNDTPQDEVEYLYEEFKEHGYNVGTYQEFKKSLQTKEDVDWYYKKGKKDGFVTVALKEFYKIVGFKEKKSTPVAHSYKETKYNTGEFPYISYYGSGRKDVNSLSKLEILNYSSTEAVVLLENYYGSVIRHVYIKNNSSYTLRYIPEGKYRIKVMYGNSWNNEKDNGAGYPKGGFMKNVSFSKSKDNDLFDFTFERTYDGISYPTYSVTLHKVANGNMSTENIGKDEFF